MVVLHLTDVFENFVEKSTLMFGIHSLYSHSASGYTWKAGLKTARIKLDFKKDELLFIILENNTRGGVSSVMADTHVVSDLNKYLIYHE